LPRVCRDAANSRQIFFPCTANFPCSYRTYCREFAATITAPIATRQTRGKLAANFFSLLGKFAAQLPRPLPRVCRDHYRAYCHDYCRKIAAILFIFCRDFFRAVTTIIAATIAATLAGHLSANTIELFTANIYVLFDALIAANDTCRIFIPIAAPLPHIYSQTLPRRVCRPVAATISAKLPRLFPQSCRDFVAQLPQPNLPIVI
jgi:hypothetical protein